MYLLGTDPDLIRHMKMMERMELINAQSPYGKFAYLDYSPLGEVKDRPGYLARTQYDVFDHGDLF